MEKLTGEQETQLQLLEDWIQDELKMYRLYDKYHYSFSEENFEGIKLNGLELSISIPNFNTLLEEDKLDVIYSQLYFILLGIIYQEYFEHDETSK